MLNKNFLSILDMDRDELETLFDLADELRLSRAYRPLDGITGALIFQKPSFRTRVSFELGIRQLGGDAIYLPDESIGIGRRESAYDIAMLMGRYADLIVARMFDHGLLEQIAHFASVPVVNALTDLSHPCQIISDMYTIRQHGRLHEGMRVVFVGDGNNVVNSWIEMATIYPIHFVLAAPEGYDPDEMMLRSAWAAGVGTVEIIRDPVQAVEGADVVYSDVWTSMGQEEESARRRNAFAPYQVNEKLMSYAQEDAIFMHCLPAHRGEEVTTGVIDGERSIIFDQAENRLHMQKALLARLIDNARSGVAATQVSVSRSIH